VPGPDAPDLVVRVAEPDGPPRATIYALHGGGLNGDYWDCPVDPSMSLVRLGVTLGFRIAHPDRPGYRENRDRWPDGLPPTEEAALHVATIQARWRDDPVLLVGQSAGSMVAVHAAALHHWPGLVGLEYSGVGVELDVPTSDDERRDRFWGDRTRYPPGTFDPGGRPIEPIVEADGASSRAWAGRFADLAARVRVPVRATFADADAWWGPVDRAAAEIRRAFTASPSVEVEIEPGAMHNLSLGWAARSYHLQVLAFGERCIDRRRDRLRVEG